MLKTSIHRHLAFVIIPCALLFIAGCTAENSSIDIPFLLTEQSQTSIADCPPSYDKQGGKCSFTLSDSTFKIYSKGRGIKTDIHGVKTEFALPLKKSEFIKGLQFHKLGNDIIIIYIVSDGNDSAGRIVRICGKTCLVKWLLHLPGMNLSIGTVEENHIYLAAHGFVSKIDLDSGAFKWKHDGLYDAATGAFNTFKAPFIGPDEVSFQSFNAKSKRVTTIMANKLLGTLTVR
jgi:hypothetical protein